MYKVGKEEIFLSEVQNGSLIQLIWFFRQLHSTTS